MVGWFGSFVVWLAGLVLLLYCWLVWFFCCVVDLFGSFVCGWLVWFFCCMVGWFGSFVVLLAGLVLLLCG